MIVNSNRCIYSDCYF